jgi:hypothetical protein
VFEISIIIEIDDERFIFRIAFPDEAQCSAVNPLPFVVHARAVVNDETNA